MICSVFSIVIVIRPKTEATDIGFVFVFKNLIGSCHDIRDEAKCLLGLPCQDYFHLYQKYIYKKNPNVMHCSTVNHSYQHPHLQLNGIILFKVYHASLLTLEKFKFVQL